MCSTLLAIELHIPVVCLEISKRLMVMKILTCTSHKLHLDGFSWYGICKEHCRLPGNVPSQSELYIYTHVYSCKSRLFCVNNHYLESRINHW